MRFKIVFVALIALAGCLRVEPQAEVMQEQTTTAGQQATTAIVEVETVETVAEHTYKLCDIPLDAELQIWVFDYCKDKKLNPYLIFAMCERESQYKADAVGDSGRSLGIMQIQEQWHTERMAELGCTDLLDARQNIIVGIDYLLELTEKNEDIGWVLMAYNGGMAYAYKQDKLSEYAEYILTRAEELEQMKAGGEND